MAAPARLAIGLLVGALFVACSQAPQPVQPAAAKPEQTGEATAAPQAAAPAPAPAEAPPPEEAPPADSAAPKSDPTVIVIDPGGEDPGDVDLVAAAKAERERRASAPRASKVITNQNLVKTKPGDKEKASNQPAGKPAPPAAPSAEGVPDGTDEAYWRGRSRELRQRWKEAVDEIAALESDADLLRRHFYAEADPYVRDGRIKPDWDRVLDRIREMRERAERRQGELAAHLEAGRRAGALPGWLREGSELEPAMDAQRPEEQPHEAIEPPIYPEPREPVNDDDGDEDGDG